MDPVTLLKRDHRVVKTLFRKFENATRASERQKIGQEIIEELSVHAAIEEQVVYPALRSRDKRLEEAALNALEEHHAAKLLLLELDKMKVSDERYASKMHVVRESVTAHIKEEEAKLLPRMARLFSRDELRVMGDAIVALKQVAPNHPHPAAPDTLPGSIVAAMLAKLNDAGKDLIRKLTSAEKAEGHRRVRRRAGEAAAAARA